MNLRHVKNRGQIRHLGFSFHDTPEALEEIIDKYEWDFVQIQLNYLDWERQDAKRQYEICCERGIPCVIMEPVRGGALANLSPDASDVLKTANPGCQCGILGDSICGIAARRDDGSQWDDNL